MPFFSHFFSPRAAMRALTPSDRNEVVRKYIVVWMSAFNIGYGIGKDRPETLDIQRPEQPIPSKETDRSVRRVSHLSGIEITHEIYLAGLRCRSRHCQVLDCFIFLLTLNCFKSDAYDSRRSH